MTAQERYIAMIRKACHDDPIIARLNAAHFNRIQKRLSVISEQVHRKFHAELRRDFRRACAKAGAPILPQDTRRWCDDTLAELYEDLKKQFERE